MSADPQAYGVDWQMTIYGGAQHSFTHPRLDQNQRTLPGVAYHQASAERAWRAMLDLFGESIARGWPPLVG